MNPTDGIQPTAATGGPDNALSQPDSPAGTTATPDTQTAWEQPPKRRRLVRRSPQMLALLGLLKRYRVGVSLVALAIGVWVAAGAIWGPMGVLVAVVVTILLGPIYTGWWNSGYPNSGRAQWRALVQEQRDKLEGLR